MKIYYETNELQHTGVKGMRWGHRKNIVSSQPHEIPKNSTGGLYNKHRIPENAMVDGQTSVPQNKPFTYTDKKTGKTVVSHMPNAEMVYRYNQLKAKAGKAILATAGVVGLSIGALCVWDRIEKGKKFLPF